MVVWISTKHLLVPFIGFPIPWLLNPLSEIRFVITGGGFYSNSNLQCIKSDKERENVRKKNSSMHTETFNTIFKNEFNPVLVQFHTYEVIVKMPFS
jgi:hypothetical protein